MTPAVEQIAYYFGMTGIASIAAWLVAAASIVLFVSGLRRSLVCWLALAAAIVGLLLANVNSNEISAIQIDFSEEMRKAKEIAEQDAGAEQTTTESDVSQQGQAAKQAEITSDNDQSKTGSQPVPVEPQADAPAGNDAQPEEEDSAEESGEEFADETADEGKPSRYAYRQRGKVERSEGMTVEDQVPISSAAEDTPVIANVRMMKMHEVAQANRLDRLNLFFARLVLTLAVVLVTVDYLRRFNTTFRALFPLPVGGRLIDSFFPKTHTVCVRDPGKQAWSRFLERIVRKGETFIYFGDRDPDATPQLGRLPLLPTAVWPIDKITRAADDREFDDDFLFESAWFGRYCFVLLDNGRRAAEVLAALADFLPLRHATRASARHTVNVIWNLPAVPAEDTLERLADLCPETNFKLLVATDRPLTETQEACFDEILT